MLPLIKPRNKYIQMSSLFVFIARAGYVYNRQGYNELTQRWNRDVFVQIYTCESCVLTITRHLTLVQLQLKLTIQIALSKTCDSVVYYTKHHINKNESFLEFLLFAHKEMLLDINAMLMLDLIIALIEFMSPQDLHWRVGSLWAIGTNPAWDYGNDLLMK